jgi:hypothetical protein
MKTVTIPLPDEAAEAFMKLSPEEKTKASFFLEAFTKSITMETLEDTLRNAAREARENGMTEAEIEDFLNSLS